jgi:protein-disulfide isomerase
MQNGFTMTVPTRRRVLARRVAVAIAAVAAFAATGCREGSATPEPTVTQQGGALDDARSVLATIGSDTVTMSELRERAGDELDQLESQYQLARSRIIQSSLDTLLRERTIAAEAKRTGKTEEALIAAEAGPGGITPSDADVEAWYRANPGRVGGRSLDQLRPQIADLLAKERAKTAEEKLMQRLDSAQKVRVTYEPYRLHFDLAKAPSRGPSNAPVTVVEFADFQCPFCRNTVPTMKQVEEKYGDRVRVVYKQFPLPNLHPYALKAAEASLCAEEQSKFWEMHDAMFADQNKLAVSDLKKTARRLGLDGKAFDSCLDSGRYVEQVQNEQKEGQRAGVNGTPALYVNGRYVEGGSVPFSVLERAIEKELARAKVGS